MKRRLLISLILVVSVAGSISARNDESDVRAWALALMKDAIVIDTHADTIGEMLNRDYDITVRNTDGHVDIPRMREGRLDCEFFACWVSPTRFKGMEIQRVMQMVDALKETAARDPHFVVVDSAEEIIAAHRAGKAAGMLCIEGGHAINDDLAVLRRFRELGVRYMTLTWSNHNNWADSSEPDQSRYGNLTPHGGLTDFGREVVREMERIGILVDISHVHDDTFWDVMAIATKPVIASHSSAWGVTPHYRNLKDEQLRAVAKNGGVVGINFYSAFVSSEFAAASQAAEKAVNEAEAAIRVLYRDQPEKLAEELKRIGETMPGDADLPRPPFSVIIDHIEHVARVAGHDHVGLGSDFDGIPSAPAGMDGCTDLVKIVIELRARGWSEENLRKLLGENFLRVIRATDVRME